MAGKTFIFREEWLTFLESLSKKQQDNVIRAVYCFAFDLELPSLTKIETVAFNCIKGSVSRDMEKYEERRAKNRENGKKGGRPRLEKTENNPEKPNGFSVLESVSNPIPNSNSAIKSTVALPPSLYSSPLTGSESEGVSEEEKEKILYEFVFEKNLAAPEKELREFIAFNNRDGRVWEKMSDERKEEAVRRWQQQPAQPPRFKKDFLEMWRKVYDALVELGAPDEVRLDALSDVVEAGTSTTHVQIRCSQRLKDYLEREDVLCRIRAFFLGYAKRKNRKYIQYIIG